MLVLLVFLCIKLKLLLSLGRCSSQNRFIGFGRIFRSLIDISGSLISVEFSGIPRLVELGGLLGCRVNFSGFFRF